MAEACSLYRLNGIAHVAGSINEELTRCIYSFRRQQNMPLHDRIIPYMERAGLYHLARLNARVHYHAAGCSIPVGLARGWFTCIQNKVKQYTIHFTWFHERFTVLPNDATEETVRIYARAYIMMLLSTQLFGDKSGNRVHIWWLSFVARLDDMVSYSWGSAALAWLYRCMCRVANRTVTCNSPDHPLARYCPLWHTRPHGFAFDDRDDSRSPHIHSSKCIMLGRAQRPCWHIDLGSGSDTICNSPDHPLARYCPFWHTRPHGFAFYDRDDSRSPHTHSSKCVMLGRGIQTLIRHASFPSPTDPQAARIQHIFLPISFQVSHLLATSDHKEERVVQRRLALDRLGDRDIVWEPYASLDVMAVVHLEILTEEHNRLWCACTCLIYFAVIEWHQVDRVLSQLGGVQYELELTSNIDWLRAKDGRGGDRWFRSYNQVWHLSWQKKVDAVLSIPRVLDPRPSTNFLRLWCRVAHRLLSPDSLIADPRAEEISQDVVQRGSSQAPSRVPMLDVPDNRRVERRQRIGTRATDCESGGDGVGHTDHRVWRGHPQRRGGSSWVASGGPDDRPTEQVGEETQEVPLTHVSSSQIYHEIHGQMYDDLAGPTFTMDMDHEGYHPDIEDMQRYQPQMSEPHGFQPQLHVYLNEPSGSSYDSWLGMGGTPLSAYGVGMPVDPPAQQRQRPARVRRAARCGTGSHLLGAFGHDSHEEDEDRQDP
ncbi:uncharacterized protein DS421_3g92480 [Arachis hypogaea]|nr:uncharacterized protein DS421_3g92480 [Arachis hypogaea]